MDFSIWQIAIVLVIALLVFGPKRLPELGSSLGRGCASSRTRSRATRRRRRRRRAEPRSSRPQRPSRNRPTRAPSPSRAKSWPTTAASGERRPWWDRGAAAAGPVRRPADVWSSTSTSCAPESSSRSRRSGSPSPSASGRTSSCSTSPTRRCPATRCRSTLEPDRAVLHHRRGLRLRRLHPRPAGDPLPGLRVHAARVLRPREAGRVPPFMLAIPFLFIAGVVFAYFVVMPIAIKFLLNFNEPSSTSRSARASTTASSASPSSRWGCCSRSRS